MPPRLESARGRSRGRGRGRGKCESQHDMNTMGSEAEIGIEATTNYLPPQARRIGELFMILNPPTFDGTGDPGEAEVWVRSMEKIFRFLECSDQEKMICVVYQLCGSADYWWESHQRTLTAEQIENFTWEEFKKELFEKYIPLSYRLRKESEFHNLRQGGLSVADYDRLFCNLSRYALEQVETDEKKVSRFCAGLKTEIRVVLASHGGLTYKEMLKRALLIEAALHEDLGSIGETAQLNQGHKRKWDNNPWGQNWIQPNQKRQWQGRQQQQPLLPSNIGNQNSRRQKYFQLVKIEGARNDKPCFRCGGEHQEDTESEFMWIPIEAGHLCCC